MSTRTIAERFSGTPDAWVGITDRDPNPHTLVDLVGDSIYGAAYFDITDLRAPAIDAALVIPDEYRLPFAKTIFEYDTGPKVFERTGGLRAPLYQSHEGGGRKTEVSRIGVVLVQNDDDPITGCVVADFEPNFLGPTAGGVELIGVVQRGNPAELERIAAVPHRVLGGERPEPGEGFWILRPMGHLFNSIDDETYSHELAEELLRLWFRPIKYALGLLSCKNIMVERVLPNRQRRRNAEQRGIVLPALHRIVVKVPGTKQPYTIAGPRRPGEPVMPAHMVRGHFAEYGTDRPLFGKYTGRFWIPAHVRGKRQADQDVKPKPYVIVPSEAA